jgi:hypothetical protein
MLDDAYGEPGPGEVTGAGEAVWPPPATTTSKRVGALDLDKFTVYKSSALILL